MYGGVQPETQDVCSIIPVFKSLIVLIHYEEVGSVRLCYDNCSKFRPPPSDFVFCGSYCGVLRPSFLYHLSGSRRARYYQKKKKQYHMGSVIDYVWVRCIDNLYCGTIRFFHHNLPNLLKEVWILKQISNFKIQ